MTRRFPDLAAALLLALLPAAGQTGEVYDFTYQATLSIDGQGEVGGIVLSGAVELGDAALAFSELTCRDTGAEAPGPALAEACAEISGGGVGWRRDDRGTLLELAMPEGLSAGADSILKGLVPLIPITRGAGQTWRALEPDSVGLAEATYRRDGAYIVRSRSAYIALFDRTTSVHDGPLRPPKTGEVRLDSQSRAHLTEDRVTELTVTATIWRAGHEIGLPAGQASVSLEMKWRESRTGEPVARAGMSVPPYAPPSEEAMRRVRAASLAAGQDATELAGIIGSADPGSDAAHRAHLALSALFAAAPESDVPECSLAAPASCRATVHALGAAGTPAAQQALAMIFERLGTTVSVPAVELQREVVRALGTRLGGEMTEATREHLIALLPDPALGTQAAYGLGAEAFRRRGTPEGEAALAPLLGPWTDDAVRRLRALGNAGALAALPEVLHALESDADVARVAVRALRRMPEATEVDAVFAIVLAPDRALLHHAALESLVGRPLGPLRPRVAEIAAGVSPEAALAAELLR